MGWAAMMIAGTVGVGCTSESKIDDAISTSMQAMRVGTGPDGRVYLGLDFLATDGSNRAVPCGRGELEVKVEVSTNGSAGPFTTLPGNAVNVGCAVPGNGEAALVLDNSGSVAGQIDLVKDAAKTFVDGVVQPGGKASLVRVATDASILAPLSRNAADLKYRIGQLDGAKAWTALYDGVRLANETFGGEIVDPNQRDRDANLEAFCKKDKRRGIVVFTDGQENNSKSEHSDLKNYPGDSIDTTLDDLHNLRVQGVTTPIYTVGLGGNVDHVGLGALAKATGGRHLSIQNANEVTEAFSKVAEYFGATAETCAEVPGVGCGDLLVRVSWKWSQDGQQFTGAHEFSSNVACADHGKGRMATLLMTLSNPGIPKETSSQLVRQTVDWVTPKDSPNVLVVLDDNHHGEFANDAQDVAASALLSAVGYRVEFINEPSNGLEFKQTDGFDVVWLSNPGYPMDDEKTVDTLLRVSARGGGVVLQGDDMSQTWGKNFNLQPLTHIKHIDNGTSSCKRRIDNNSGDRYWVTLSEHPITNGITPTTFWYGDDIDYTLPLSEGENVIAWAESGDNVGIDKSCVSRRPVIVTYEPSVTK